MFRRSRTLRIFEKLKLKGKKDNRRYFSSGDRTNRRNSCASNVLSVLTREFDESLRSDEYEKYFKRGKDEEEGSMCRECCGNAL